MPEFNEADMLGTDLLDALDEDEKPSMWLANKTNIPQIILPFTIGGNKNSGNLFKLFDDTVNKLVEAN